MNLSHIAFNALDSKPESIFGKNPNKFMATCALGLSLASSLTFADNEREREREKLTKYRHGKHCRF